MILLSKESISIITFPARTSTVNMCILRQHSANHVMHCLINVFGTLQGTWDQSNKNPSASVGYLVDIISNVTLWRCCCYACWLPENLVNWVLSNAQMTGTTVVLAGTWSCIFHYQSTMLNSLTIGRPSELVRFTGPKLRCASHGRCTKWNWIQLKISLKYNCLKICESSSIMKSMHGPISNSERRVSRASEDWNFMILKVSSPRLSCWWIEDFIHWVNQSVCWKSCVDHNWYLAFDSSEYFHSWYNPVALPYTSPVAFSTPTSSLWALVWIESVVQVRSGS